MKPKNGMVYLNREDIQKLPTWERQGKWPYSPNPQARADLTGSVPPSPREQEEGAKCPGRE